MDIEIVGAASESLFTGQSSSFENQPINSNTQTWSKSKQGYNTNNGGSEPTYIVGTDSEIVSDGNSNEEDGGGKYYKYWCLN